jgi:serine-type D-Ala-D-Ala carboxypeptidase/endopeptidase (penicillin-binding protein 4)
VKALPALLALAALLASGVPALAVDRTLGADVPKPSASGAPWTDGEIAALNANIGIALAGAGTVRSAHVGILAVDARDGRVLYQRNPDELFQPASTSKLVVASAILDALGPTYRFHTDAVMSGTTLVVRAGGDPFLKDADFDDLATTLAAKGIHTVGQVAFDVSRYEGPNYPPGWEWDDVPYYYSPLISALSFEENLVHLTVAPGDAAGAPATVTSAPINVLRTPVEGCPPTLEPIFAAEVKTGAAGSTDTVDLTRRMPGCTAVVGAIPLGAKPDTIDATVPYPPIYAWYALRAALERHGVASSNFTRITGPDLRLMPAPADAQVVWSHDSEPLGDVVADLFFPSDNLVAEMLLRELGIPRPPNPPGQGTTAGGLAAEKAWLTSIGVDPGTVAMADGSGLSAYDRVTPSALVAILAHDWNGPNRNLILDDLPIAGVRGTLKSAWLGTPLERHLFAKTGGLSHVSTLAGYVATMKHGTVIFAFQVDDWIGDATALRELRARVLTHFVSD